MTAISFITNVDSLSLCNFEFPSISRLTSGSQRTPCWGQVTGQQRHVQTAPRICSEGLRTFRSWPDAPTSTQWAGLCFSIYGNQHYYFFGSSARACSQPALCSCSCGYGHFGTLVYISKLAVSVLFRTSGAHTEISHSLLVTVS